MFRKVNYSTVIKNCYVVFAFGIRLTFVSRKVWSYNGVFLTIWSADCNHRSKVRLGRISYRAKYRLNSSREIGETKTYLGDALILNPHPTWKEHRILVVGPYLL